MIRSGIVTFVLSVFVMACTVDSVNQPPGNDMGSGSGGGDGTGGGGGDGGGGGTPAACTVDSSYPDLGALSGGNAVISPQDAAQANGPQVLSIGVTLGGTDVIDAIFINLWDGYGVFTNGIVPGTYTIAGAETSLADCGACVVMVGDLNQTANTFGQQLMANGGTLTITSIDPTPGTGSLVGSLSNITFREVQVDANNVENDVPNGCTSSIAGASFDLPVVAGQ